MYSYVSKYLQYHTIQYNMIQVVKTHMFVYKIT